MKLDNLKRDPNNLKINSNYSIDTDKTKGNEIEGYDQLAIRWSENGLSKLIQIFPEVSDMKIKKWKIWICASKDNENGRYWWNEIIYESRKKIDIISEAREKINEGIDKLNNISENNLKLIKL